MSEKKETLLRKLHDALKYAGKKSRKVSVDERVTPNSCVGALLGAVVGFAVSIYLFSQVTTGEGGTAAIIFFLPIPIGFGVGGILGNLLGSIGSSNEDQIRYHCPNCQEVLNSPLADAGRNDSCPLCSTKFVVPGFKTDNKKR